MLIFDGPTFFFAWNLNILQHLFIAPTTPVPSKWLISMNLWFGSHKKTTVVFFLANTHALLGLCPPLFQTFIFCKYNFNRAIGLVITCFIMAYHIISRLIIVIKTKCDYFNCSLLNMQHSIVNIISNCTRTEIDWLYFEWMLDKFSKHCQLLVLTKHF